MGVDPSGPPSMVLLGHGRAKHGQHVIAQHGLERPLVALHRGLGQGIEARELAVPRVSVLLSTPS